MKVYQAILLVILVLVGITAFTGEPKASAQTPADAISTVVEAPNPPAFKGELPRSLPSDTDHLRAIPRNEINRSNVTSYGNAAAQGYPTVNVVTLVQEAFYALGQRQGGQAVDSLASQPFNQGIILLGEAGYLSGHDTLAILHTNSALPLEQRFTGFQIFPSGIVPSRISIHSEQMKLKRAIELYGNQPY